jgi:hypothetical protein
MRQFKRSKHLNVRRPRPTAAPAGPEEASGSTLTNR